jgi:hypothetical protein
LRVLLVILVGALLSVIAGMATLPYLINWEEQRARVEAQASQLTGQTVTIAGPIDLRLLPRPRLSLGAVSIVGAGGEAADRLTIAQLDLGLSLLGLARGAIEIERLDLQQPVFVLRRAGDGDPLAELGAIWQAVSRPGRPLEVAIAGGQARLERDAERSAVQLDAIDLVLRAAGGEGALEAEGSVRLDQRRLGLRASLGAMAAALVAERSLQLQLELAEGAAPPVALRFAGALRGRAPRLVLAGEAGLSGEDLGQAAAMLGALLGRPELAALGTAAVPFVWQGDLALAPERLRLDPGELTVGGQQGQARLAVAWGAEPRLDVALDLPGLDLADLPPPATALKGPLVARLLAQPGSLDLRLGELRHRGDAIRQLGLKLAVGADGVARIEDAHALLPGHLDVRIEGQIAGARDPRLDGRLRAVGDDLGASLAWLGLATAERPPGVLRAVSVTAALAAGIERVRLGELELRLDASRIGGTVEAALAGARPAVRADLAADRLTLDSYGIEPLNGARTQLAALLKAFDLDLALEVGRLSWGELRGAKLTLAAVAEGGKVTLREASLGAFEDSSAKVTGSFDLASRRFDLATELSSARLGQALRRLGLVAAGQLDRFAEAELKGRLAGRLEKFDLTAALELGEAGRVTLEGAAGWAEAQPDCDLIVEATHPDIFALLQQLGRRVLFVATPAPAPLRLAGRVRRGPAAPLALSGSVSLGATTFTGRVSHAEQAPRPRLEAEVSIGNLQRPTLAALLAFAGIRPTSDPFDPIEPGSWSAMPWPVGWLGAADGVLRVTGKGGLLGDQFELTARLDDRLARIERLALAAWHGEVAAELALDGRSTPMHLEVAADLDDVDAALLTAWLGARPGLEGALDGRLETTSAGADSYAMIRSLAGRLELALTSGALTGYDAARLKRALAAGAAPGSGRADLLPATLSGRFALSRGIAEAAEVGIELDGVKGTVGGSIDILLGVTDLALGLQPPSGDPVLFKLVGPIRRPQTLLRTSARIGAEQAPAAPGP